jgi:hypothetical protein
MGGGDDNVGFDGPNHNETNSGDGYDNVLDENRNNEGGKDVCDDANHVGKFCDGDNGDGATVMALSTILVAMTAMMLLTLLTVVTLSVKSTVSVALVLLQDLPVKVPLEPLSTGFN